MNVCNVTKLDREVVSSLSQEGPEREKSLMEISLHRFIRLRRTVKVDVGANPPKDFNSRYLKTTRFTETNRMEQQKWRKTENRSKNNRNKKNSERIRPNYFLSTRLSDPSVVEKVTDFQVWKQVLIET